MDIACRRPLTVMFLVTLMASCGALESANVNDAGGADSSADSGSTDSGSSDSGGRSDSGNLNFCVSPPSDTVLCDDFERADVKGNWDDLFVSPDATVNRWERLRHVCPDGPHSERVLSTRRSQRKGGRRLRGTPAGPIDLRIDDLLLRAH